MKKKIREFVEAYNQRMDWNAEILKEVQLSLDDCSGDFLHDLLNGYLSQEKITEENYDLDNAEVYDCIRGQKELQAFSNECLRTHYFWCTLGISETEYKNERIAYITSELKIHKSSLESQIKTLQNELSAVELFCNKFENI